MTENSLCNPDCFKTLISPALGCSNYIQYWSNYFEFFIGQWKDLHFFGYWKFVFLCIERISCVLYGYITCQLQDLWSIGKGRTEGGAPGRQKEFWEKARCGEITREDVMRQTHSTWAQVTGYVAECRLKQLAYFSYDLVREEPSYMAKVFVNIFWVWVLLLGAWGWEEEPGPTSTSCASQNFFFYGWVLTHWMDIPYLLCPVIICR